MTNKSPLKSYINRFPHTFSILSFASLVRIPRLLPLHHPKSLPHTLLVQHIIQLPHLFHSVFAQGLGHINPAKHWVPGCSFLLQSHKVLLPHRLKLTVQHFDLQLDYQLFINIFHSQLAHLKARPFELVFPIAKSTACTAIVSAANSPISLISSPIKFSKAYCLPTNTTLFRVLL